MGSARYEFVDGDLTLRFCGGMLVVGLLWVQNLRAGDEARQATRALVLVPTKELSEQVTAHMKELIKYCEGDVLISNVASGTTSHLQR